MPSIRPNNPAARLYLILDESQKYDSSATIGSVWAAVLDTPESGKLWSRVGLVYGLPREIKRLLQLRPDYDPHEMSWWEPLSKTLTFQGSRQPWQYLSAGITDDILGHIRSRAKTLSLTARETVIPGSTIDELRTYITDIRNAMADESEVDEDLANFLDQRLEHMDDLLGDIQIIGAVGVKPSVDAVVAEVDAVSEELKETLTPRVWEWWERLLGRTRTVFATVAVVSGALTSTAVAVKALTSGVPQLEDNQQQSEEQASRELPSSTQESPSQDVEDKNNSIDADFKDVQREGKKDGED